MTESQAPRCAILAVDDNPANLELIHEMLAADYEVLFATTGHEALEVAAGFLPDLILLDVRMPGMDGMEVCRRLKDDIATRHIPVIFVTALVDNDNEEAGLRLGAIDYVTKPYSQAILKARIANHLELKRHRDLLAALVWLDGLTGIPNRRHFDEYLEKEFRRASAGNGRPLSLIMIDIDHFQQFNASEGPLAGDECLKRIAAVLQRVSRGSMDQLFRYAGDEFACVLRDTPLADAVRLAENYRQTINTLAIPIPDPLADRACLTVTMGVADILPSPACHAADLIAAAEYALYQARATGRDRVGVAGSDGTEHID